MLLTPSLTPSGDNPEDFSDTNLEKSSSLNVLKNFLAFSKSIKQPENFERPIAESSFRDPYESMVNQQESPFQSPEISPQSKGKELVRGGQNQSLSGTVNPSLIDPESELLGEPLSVEKGEQEKSISENVKFEIPMNFSGSEGVNQKTVPNSGATTSPWQSLKQNFSNLTKKNLIVN